MLRFVAMCQPKELFAVAVAFLFSSLAGMAQQSSPQFQPGEWKIDSVVAMSTGKTMNSTSQVCANDVSDPWKQHQPNLTCDPLQVTAAPGGFRVQLHCKGGSGPVVWETRSDILTVLTQNGAAYTAKGTTVSSTNVPGQSPLTVTAKLTAQGTRVGPCTAGSKP